MATVITTAIEKGGTGKTTTVVNLAALMADEGNKVLVVDMDQQANATFMLTQHDKDDGFYEGKGVHNMFRHYEPKNFDVHGFIHPTEIQNIDIIPSTNQTPRAIGQLDLLEKEFGVPNYTFLKSCIDYVADEYDFIIIDTPPARDVMTLASIYSADQVIIPLLCDNFSMKGFTTTMAIVNEMESRKNAPINILGALLTRIERSDATSYVIDTFNESDYADLVFKARIRKGVIFSKSTIYGQPVVTLSKKAAPSLDYMELWEEIKDKLAKYAEGSAN